jgi:5-methylcytosine-specific restriction endonuclease McrA
VLVAFGVFSFAAAAAESNPNETCLSCHDTEGFSTTLDNGEEMPLYVPRDSYLKSVHGEAELTCDNCHENYSEYPHPEKTFKSVGGFSLKAEESCANCHPDEAASYLKDYHGKTGALRKLKGTAAVTSAPEATCADCHGAHNILRADNPASKVNPGNLAATCQDCHEKATPKFAAAFTHKTPTSTDAESAVTYWINVFYQVVIPALVGSLVLFMLLELVFMLRHRRSHKTA